MLTNSDISTVVDLLEAAWPYAKLPERFGEELKHSATGLSVSALSAAVRAIRDDGGQFMPGVGQITRRARDMEASSPTASWYNVNGVYLNELIFALGHLDARREDNPKRYDADEESRKSAKVVLRHAGIPLNELRARGPEMLKRRARLEDEEARRSKTAPRKYWDAGKKNREAEDLGEPVSLMGLLATWRAENRPATTT